MLKVEPSNRISIINAVKDYSTLNVSINKKSSLDGEIGSKKFGSGIFNESKSKNHLVLPKVNRGNSITSKLIIPSSKFLSNNSFINVRKSMNSSFYLDKKEQENKTLKHLDSLTDKLEDSRRKINANQHQSPPNKLHLLKKSMFFIKLSKN